MERAQKFAVAGVAVVLCAVLSLWVVDARALVGCNDVGTATGDTECTDQIEGSFTLVSEYPDVTLGVCRGSSLSSGSLLSACVGAGGELIFVAPGDLQDGDLLSELFEGQYYLGDWNIKRGGGGIPGAGGGESDPFDPADLDPNTILQMFWGGFTLVAVAWAIGFGVSAVLRGLKARH